MKKVVVISGGTDGLGKVVAQTLKESFDVVILGRNAEKVTQFGQELGCDGLVCDVSNAVQVSKTIETIIKKHGRIDVFVQSAGVWVDGELENNSIEQIDRAIDTNTKGIMYLTRAVIPNMKKQKAGTIVNVISVGGLTAKSERSLYYTSKWAITGFTKSIQLELAKYGIRVMGIYPGKMNTKMFEKIGIHKDMSNAVSLEDVAQTIKFIIDLPPETIVTDLVIRHLND